MGRWGELRSTGASSLFEKMVGVLQKAQHKIPAHNNLRILWLEIFAADEEIARLYHGFEIGWGKVRRGMGAQSVSWGEWLAREP